MNNHPIVNDINDITKNGRRIVCSINFHETRSIPGWVTTKKTTYYTIVSATVGTTRLERGSVERRFQEFYDFYIALTTKYPHEKFPDFLVNTNKWVENHYSKEFIEGRQLLLAAWLNKSINLSPEIQNDDLVSDFLHMSLSTTYDESLTGLSSSAQYGSLENTGITKIFSTTSDEKVKITQKDLDYLPQQVMQVYRITDDDL